MNTTKTVINRLKSLIIALERQSRYALITRYYKDEFSNEYVFIHNEYAAVKLDIRYYKAIECSRDTLPPLANLIDVSQSGQGIGTEMRNNKRFVSNAGIELLNKLYSFEHDETTDTNITVSSAFDNNLPMHYFVNSDYVIAVNADIHETICKLYHSIGCTPFHYSTTDVNAVRYYASGVDVAVLPISINQHDKLPRAIRSIYQFQTLTAKTA